MRNIFDQYLHPENRLTHSLATVLYEDATLLKNFLVTFCPSSFPSLNKLKILEQGLPGRVEIEESEAEQKGLPDVLIFDERGWGLAIESKISSGLTKDQLQRHIRTVQRCGFNQVYGLSITLQKPRFSLENWTMVTWQDIYSWACQNEPKSSWAKRMVEYFNVAEVKMANDGYLTEGTITEFSGIDFDPYTYLEGKRVLKLLMRKIRQDTTFLKYMGIDQKVLGRSAITDTPRLWDCIRFSPPEGRPASDFMKYPHCTVGFDDAIAEATITFPSAMNHSMRRKLAKDTPEEFAHELKSALKNIQKSFRGVKGYRPFIRIQQRRYPSQKSLAIVDGVMEFDLRAAFGEAKPDRGPRIRPQAQWTVAVFEMLHNKNSNLQFQIGTQFFYQHCDKIKNKNADKLFIETFKALRPFVKPVINN